MRAIIYSRVSTPDQEKEGTSLKTQQEHCRAYAEEHGYTVIAAYQNVYSGAKYRERPGLSKLREQVRAGDADVVIAYALDRLSRQQSHLAIIAEEIEDHDAQLAFVTEDFEDSAVGRFIRSAKAFAAEVEREKISERVTRGRKARIASGHPHPGPYPLYGYQWRDKERTRLILDPRTAPVARRIFDDYLAGHTLRGIAQRLHDDGIPSSQGSPTWAPNAIGRLLRHPNYTGNAYGWLGTAREQRNKYDLKDAILLPAGTIEPLVSQAEWDAVQERMVRNKQRASRRTYEPEATLLRGGFVHCGACGRAMSATRDKRGVYRYRCASGHRLRAERCNISIAAHILDDAVWERIVAFFTKPELICRILSELDNDDDDPQEIARLDRRLREIEQQQASVAQAISLLVDSDPDTVAPLTVKLTNLAEHRRNVARERAAVEDQRSSREAFRNQMETLEDWQGRMAKNINTACYREQREFLDLLEIKAQVFPAAHEPRYSVTAFFDPGQIVSPSAT